EAARMAFDEINAAGGVHGRQIRFIVEDHAYQMPRAIANFNKLIRQDGVFAMLLNLGTPMNLAGFPLMQARKVANVAPLSGARQMIEGDISLKYSTFSSYYDQILAGIEYLVTMRQADTVCAMYLPTDFGTEVQEAAAAAAAILGKSAADILLRALEAAGPDLTPESFRAGMETLRFHNAVAGIDISYGPGDHRGGDRVVISVVENGAFREVARR